MCRSSAKRRNSNARHVAKRAAHPRSNAVRWVWSNGDSFSEITARDFALTKTTYPVDAAQTGEVNWPFCAELMNRATKERAA